MEFSRHINITGGALKNWLAAQFLDSICVGLLWWVGLDFLHVPWAPFWAALAASFQIVPHFGSAVALLGPAILGLIDGGAERLLWVLGLYGVIVLIDGLLLQPLIMKRTARVPLWASLVAPIVLSFMFGFWGVLLAAPLLAVIFAYRAVAKKRARDAAERVRPHQTPPGQEITGGVLLAPEEKAESTGR